MTLPLPTLAACKNQVFLSEQNELSILPEPFILRSLPKLASACFLHVFLPLLIGRRSAKTLSTFSLEWLHFSFAISSNCVEHVKD